MAILKNLVVNGSSRFLNTAYFQDVQIGGAATFASISASGNITAGGNLYSTTGNLYLKNLLAINGQTDSWLRINANKAFTSGVYFGSSNVKIDANVQVGNNGSNLNIVYNATPANGSFTVGSPATFNSTVTSTSITNSGKLISNTIDCQEIRWTKAEEITVADLGGTFIVAPTIYFTEGSTSVNVTAISGTTVTMSITDNAINSADLGGHTWKQYSKIKLSGAIGDCVLGSADGYLSAQLNTTSHVANVIATIANASKLTVNTTYSGANVKNLAMMMYAVGNGSTSNTYKVGMVLTSYGDNYRSYLDIYSGGSNTSVTRIGNLGGLTYDDSTLSNQWGLLTTNGYFTGTVTANAGHLGTSTNGFVIDANGIYYGSRTSNTSGYFGLSATSDFTRTINGTSRTDLRMALGQNFGVSATGTLYAGSAVISGDITANTGYIGGTSGWTIASQQLSSGTLGADNSLYLGTKNLGSNTSIAGRSGSDWRLTVGSKFGVTNTGALYASSGTIGGWTLDASSLYTGTKTETSSIIVSSANVTRTINGASRTGLRLVVGSNFGVSNTGVLYANSANISGTLTAGANSQIGPWYVTTTSIYKGENALGSTTSGAAYFGDLGLSVGNKFKVDASGNGSIILGELSEGQTHIEVDSDSFDVCSGATTGNNAVKLATFGEITRIGSGGSNVFIDGGGFSFTNTDGDEMMKINVDNVVIGKEGSSYFYVDSNSIILKDNENADVFKVESGGGITESTTFNDDHYDKFSNTQISGGYTKTHPDNGAKSSVNKITVKFYKTYTETIVINGQNVTREFLKFNNAIILDTRYYTTSFVENSNVQVTLTSGSGGGVQYINNLLLIYCDSEHPRFNIVWTYSHKTETYSNLNMDGNMNVTGVISAENKIQSDEIFANNITADDFTFWANGVNINEVQTASANTTITGSNKIDQKPAIGAQLTLYSGIYLLVANGDFNSGATSGNRVVQLAIYEGIDPVNSNVLTRTRVRVVNAASYWSGLTTHAIVTVPFNTGQTFTVGLTSSIAQSSASSTSIQAIYLRPPEIETE